MVDAIKLGSGDLSDIGNATINTAQSYLDTVARTAKSSSEIEFAKKIVANKFEGVINAEDITLGTINDTLKISFNEDSVMTLPLGEGIIISGALLPKFIPSTISILTPGVSVPDCVVSDLVTEVLVVSFFDLHAESNVQIQNPNIK